MAGGFPLSGGPARPQAGLRESPWVGGRGELVRGKPLTASLPRREAIIVEIKR